MFDLILGVLKLIMGKFFTKEKRAEKDVVEEAKREKDREINDIKNAHMEEQVKHVNKNKDEKTEAAIKKVESSQEDEGWGNTNV